MKGYPFKIGQRIWLSTRDYPIPYRALGTVTSGVLDACQCGAALYKVEFDFYPYPRSDNREETWWLVPDEHIAPFDEGSRRVAWDTCAWRPTVTT